MELHQRGKTNNKLYQEEKVPLKKKILLRSTKGDRFLGRVQLKKEFSM